MNLAMNRSTSKIMLPALVAVAVLGMIQVYGVAYANPFYGYHIEGYSDGYSTNSGPAFEIYGDTNFAGTTYTSLTSDILSGASTAGWSTTSGGTTGWIYQHLIRVAPNDNNVYFDAQVRQVSTDGTSTLKWGCGGVNCHSLGSFTSTSYVYYLLQWQRPARTSVLVWTETHTTSGGDNVYSLNYTPANYGDTSNDFAVGEKFVHYGSADIYVKYLQVGVESDTATQNWKVEQYGVQYYPDDGCTCVRDIGSDNVFTNTGTPELVSWGQGNPIPNQGGEISTSASNGYPTSLGGSAYSVTATVKGANDIVWSPSSTQLPSGTALWGHGAVTIFATEQSTGNSIDGLSVTLKDSNHNVIASGYTPLNVLVSTSGTYYIDFDNYGPDYYTNSPSKSYIQTYDVYSWGGEVKASLSAVNSYAIQGVYYNNNNPGNYALVKFKAHSTSCNCDPSPYVGELDSSGHTLSQGFTPYSVGLPAGGTTPPQVTVDFDNGGPYTVSTATYNVQQVSWTVFPAWGAQQVIKMPNTGNSSAYYDQGNYS